MKDTSSPFSLPLLRAVNNWQRGGDEKQKARRGAELQIQAQSLPSYFRTCALMCFRQLALAKGSLWKLADMLQLPETIAAWTVSPEVARHLKGGVPPQSDYQGVIFAIPPPDGSVVINLDRLYREQSFLDAVGKYMASIDGFSDGIGRYWGSQYEVVVELSHIHLVEIHELGGYSSGRNELAELYFGRDPSPEDLSAFDRLLAAAKVELGAAWIGGDAKDRVLKKIQQVTPQLRVIKQLQEA
jgi:hypothetical protein